jgi:hypothetical protein
MWEKTAMAYFKMLSWQWSARTGENQETLSQIRQNVKQIHYHNANVGVQSHAS